MKSAHSKEIEVAGQELVTPTEPAWKALGRYGCLNVVVMLMQVGGWVLLLTALDDVRLPLWVRALALALFCLMMQGVFTLLHEYCHRNCHRDSRVNYVIGWVTATLFPTAPTLFRVQHWGHHRRNRSEAERAEFIHAGENAWLKTVQYYFAVGGGIWLVSAVFPPISIFLPYRSIEWFRRRARFNTYAAAFTDFKLDDWRRMQVEGCVLLAVWCGIVLYGPWHWQTLTVAYAAFAFSWSSLQWVYHLHTPLHVIEGAYNLRAPWLVRVLFLNFNYNLTHHRHPSLPWQELHRQSDPRETQPLWYRYLRIAQPPVPFPDDPSTLGKNYF